MEYNVTTIQTLPGNTVWAFFKDILSKCRQQRIYC